jgi:CPA2 family monovalent cation:H+ antiporter-2
MNPATVREAAKEGEPIFFGDATQDAALDHAQIRTAKVMVVAIPDAPATERITFLARSLNVRLHIIIRTRFLREVERLHRLGANEVIPEEFETSVAIFSRVLERFGIPEEQIQEQVAALRSHCYEVLRIQEMKANVLTE